MRTPGTIRIATRASLALAALHAAPVRAVDERVFRSGFDPLAPYESGHLPGAPFVLAKNWDFGTRDVIRDTATLVDEFQFHDQFGTIANGTHYGAVIVAPTAASAIPVGSLPLPDPGHQPVEDATRPYREFTPTTMVAHVRSIDPDQTQVGPAWRHDLGCGSFVSKFALPSGGLRLGKDLVWETRVRMVDAPLGYWFALWTSGSHWDAGPEMDVVEAFTGTPESGLADGAAFHVNAVPSTNDAFDYGSWWNGMGASGMPYAEMNLKLWHVFTWVYLRDDSYTVYMDGYVFQRGHFNWQSGSTDPDLRFLFDFTWGHTDVWPVNEAFLPVDPAADAPVMTYEIDYSRVFLRE